MLETLNPPGTIVPQVKCEGLGCGKTTNSQVYTIELTRQKLTREWVFCSLTCLRRSMAPIS